MTWERCSLCAGWGCRWCLDRGVVRLGGPRGRELFWSVWRGWAYGAIAGLLILLGVWAWANPL